MAGLPTDVQRRTWQQKLLQPGQSLPISKEIGQPHNGEEVLVGAAAPPRLTISLNQDWRFRRIESAAEPESVPPELTDGPVWEPANLPHSVRLEPLNASAGRNFQGHLLVYAKSSNCPLNGKTKSSTCISKARCRSPRSG